MMFAAWLPATIDCASMKASSVRLCVSLKAVASGTNTPCETPSKLIEEVSGIPEPGSGLTGTLAE